MNKPSCKGRPARLSNIRTSLLAVLLACCGLVQAQVTYFEHPPTADELRAALALPAAAGPDAGAGAGPRSRGIDFDAAHKAPAVPAPGPAAAAAAGNDAGGLPASDGTRRNPAIAMPVAFAFGTSRILPASLPFLEAMAAALEKDPALQLVIEGHTDAAGTTRGNMMLSWERAMAVFRALVEKYGIDPARLRPLGKGASEPLAGTAATDQVNRRVQFRVAGQG